MPNRGHLSLDFTKAVVRAGEVTEVTVEVEMGINARGVVVDGRGAPIAGAEVLVAGWTGGIANPLARTDGEGRFRTVRHGNGNGSIEFHDGRRRHLRECAV